MRLKGQEGYENQRKGQWSSTLGNDAWNKDVPGEMMATARNSWVKDKSVASITETKGLPMLD